MSIPTAAVPSNCAGYSFLRTSTEMHYLVLPSFHKPDISTWHTNRPGKVVFCAADGISLANASGLHFDADKEQHHRAMSQSSSCSVPLLSTASQR